MINEDALVGLGLSQAHLDTIFKKLPNGVTYQLQRYANHLFLAGGAIRAILNSEPINDVDLFAQHPLIAEAAAQYFVGGKATEKLHVTDNAFTIKDVSPHVQIVRRDYYDTPQAVLDSFDFVVCKAAIWHDGTTWQSRVDPGFFNDLEQQKLTYCSPEGQDPRDSLLRVLKFSARGYSVDARSLAKIVTQTVKKAEYKERQGVYFPSQELEDILAADFGGTEDRKAQSLKIRVCGSSRK